MRRRLAREHFAFLRGLIQGGEVRALWPRYLALEGRFDPRLAEKTVRWLKDELAAIARRDRRPRFARLVAMDLWRLPPDPTQPSLEQFAQRFEPGFYGEQELLKLLEAEFPPSKRANRRARLIARQLEALAWLEAVAATEPELADLVASWLPAATARRLSGAKIDTLADLIDRVNGKGHRWWSGIPATGAVKGARILAWLAPHAARLGRPIGEHVATPRRQLRLARIEAQHRRTAVVPLDQFLVPGQLDGSSGVYRAPRHLNLLAANTDYDAIRAWLRSKRSPHTVRAYTKEAERYLLWAILVKGKPMSSMTVEDCEDYRDFLADPQPPATWCGQRGRERWGPLWRPFNGPLDARSERHAVTILKTLYQWLNSQGYLVGNPWAGVTPRMSATPSIQAGRALTRKQWQFVGERIAELPDTGANRRLHIALTLLYVTGMRREEIVTRKVSDLTWQPFDDGTGGWMLDVVGKGGKLRQVPIPDAIMQVVQSYLVLRGLSPDPGHPSNRDARLLGKIHDAEKRIPGRRVAFDPKQGISAGTLYDQVGAFLDRCADAWAATSPSDADRLRMASTHWLRHTHGSHAIAAGIPVEVVRDNLGHASVSTTGIYVTTERRRRHAEVSKLARD